jgi:dihydrodipicolinate synthase/N-acetylneuraminate lyase
MMAALLYSLFTMHCGMCIRWALERMGKLPSGALRLPLLEMEQQHHQHVEEALQAAGCL